MALTVLDASVVIAWLDPADVLHVASETALREAAGDDLMMPASAVCETLVRPARTGRTDAVLERLRALDLKIVPLDEPTAIHAARLRGRHRALRLPDALVIATAEVLGADTLLSGDRRWRRISNLVRVP